VYADPTLPASTQPPGVPEPAAGPPPDDLPTTVGKWALGVMGSALLLEGARRIGTYLAQHPPDSAPSPDPPVLRTKRR
jgi:hypothetical protein